MNALPEIVATTNPQTHPLAGRCLGLGCGCLIMILTTIGGCAVVTRIALHHSTNKEVRLPQPDPQQNQPPNSVPPR